MKQTLVVIGGTGMLGKPVAERFLQAGHRVRVFTRSAEKARRTLKGGFEIFQGNVEDGASLDQALAGADGVHINLKGGFTPEELDRIEHRGTANIAEAAARASIKRISLITYAAQLENYPDVPYARAKALGERAVRDCGVPFTLFRAAQFMESLPFYFKNGRGMVIGRQPHPIHWLAAKDYAGQVARAFETERAAGKTFTLFGPEAFTQRQAVERYCQAVHPQAGVHAMPIAMLAALGFLSRNAEIKFVASLMRFFDRVGEQGDAAEAWALLGKPATTLGEWAKQAGSQAGACR